MWGVQTSAGEAIIDHDAAAAVSHVGGFEAFYGAKADGLYRALTLALGDRELGYEAADEALARTYQHWQRISRYDNPAGWAYRVGLNWARNRLRKRSREVVSGTVPALAVPALGVTDVEPALLDALAGLPLKVRSVVVLRYYLDWSTAQTAQALGIPEGTVKSRLSTGLAALARKLEET